jgi:hypothetical protein
MATTVVSKGKRIAGVLRNVGAEGVSLVNCFTIAVNIEGVPQNGSPPKALHFGTFFQYWSAFFPTPHLSEESRAENVCPLTSGLGGRFEANYTLMGENTNVGFPPIHTFALQFGVTLPMR